MPIPQVHKDWIFRSKRAVRELGNPEIRVELIKRLLARLELKIAYLERSSNPSSLHLAGTNPNLTTTTSRKQGSCSGTAIGGIMVDWFLQWLVNQRMTFISLLAWIFWSLPVALSLGWGTEMVAFALTHDPDRPERG